MTHPHRHDEQGSAVLEIMLVTPLLLMLLAALIGAARLTLAHQRVDAAAAQAARAASTAHNPTAAGERARTTAHATLQSDAQDCQAMVVSINLANFHPGGSVSVHITCTANLGVGVPGLSGTRQISATAGEVIDSFAQVSR